MIDIPVLTTERLTLRAPSLLGMDSFLTFMRSDRAKFVGQNADLAPFQAWAAVSNMIGHWTLRGYGLWMIHDRTTDEVIGHCGLLHWYDWPEAELAYCLYDARHEGHGNITEAARAALPYAANTFGMDRVCSYIAPENSASLSVANRLGATFEQNIDLRGEPAGVYRHTSWKEAA